MTDKVNVCKHVRRRTGRTAQVAASLGFPDTVNVKQFTRKRPVEPWMGGRWEQKMPGMWQRQYSKIYPHGDIYGNIFHNPEGRYTWALYYEDGDTIAFGTVNTLQQAKDETDRAYERWFYAMQEPEKRLPGMEGEGIGEFEF